jgi:hypothetical protein
MGGGGVGGLPMRGVFMGGAVKGKRARAGSLTVVTVYMVPVVWCGTIPSYSSILVALVLSAVPSAPSIILIVVLVLCRTLKPGTPEPSILLPWTGPGQASGGALDAKSRPWPPSLMQEQTAKAGTAGGVGFRPVRVSSERLVVGISARRWWPWSPRTRKVWSGAELLCLGLRGTPGRSSCL